jgi:hypothetical protein
MGFLLGVVVTYVEEARLTITQRIQVVDHTSFVMTTVSPAIDLTLSVFLCPATMMNKVFTIYI